MYACHATNPELCLNVTKRPTACSPCPPYPTQAVGVESKTRLSVECVCGKSFIYTLSALLNTATINMNHGKKNIILIVLHNHIYPPLSIAAKGTSDPDSLGEITQRKTPFWHLTVIFQVCQIRWNFVPIPLYLQSVWMETWFLFQGFGEGRGRIVCVLWTDLYSS